MERKIGEIFEFGGEWYQCIKGLNCLSCFFNGSGNCDKILCSLDERTDSTSVFFKKLEKVGEPVTVKGRTFQKLTSDNNSCKECVFNVPNKACCKNSYIEGICDDNGFWVEIKQSKEDMEEKEQCGDNRFEVIEKAKKHLLSSTNIESSKEEMKVLDNFLIRCWQMGWLDKYNDAKHSNSENIGKNLKEFNLEAAKLGKPVCTRDGRKARIICFDARCNLPIIALITNARGDESLASYKSNGRFINLDESDCDLMMLPEKKEGWVNVYNADTTFHFVEGMVYNTKDEAIQKAKEEITTGQREKSEYVDTVKINWEEQP